MTHQQRETNNSDASSNDTLAQQIHDLRSEVAVLSKLISTQLEGEDYANEEPNKAMALATTVGFLVGLFVSRGRRQ